MDTLTNISLFTLKRLVDYGAERPEVELTLGEEQRVAPAHGLSHVQR